MPIVYVLTNPAFESYVKIGRTSDLEQRLRNLDNTSVPLPFRCEFAVEVDDDISVERLLHQAFADNRVRSNREFFEIDASRVIAALKLTGGKDVTPRDDIAEDREGLMAMAKAIVKRSRSKFDVADVQVGDVLTFSRDSSYTAQVISPRTILFEGQEMSLSKAALLLLNRDGYHWKQANGWAYWMKDGETLTERAGRLISD
jgi:hypothetical protein